MTHSVKLDSALEAHIQNAIASAFAKFTPAELVEFIADLNTVVLEQIEDDGTPTFEGETLLEFHQKGAAITTLICNLAQVHGLPCREAAPQPNEQVLQA